MQAGEIDFARQRFGVEAYHVGFRILKPCTGVDPKRKKILSRTLDANNTESLSIELEVNVLGIENEEGENTALLIGYYQDRKENVKEDLASMRRVLYQRGYNPARIEILEGEAATKGNIQNSLERIARESTSLDHTLVYFSGHGAYDGISVHGNGPERRIKQKEMYQWLANIRGDKALLLDCCRSGAFLEGKHKRYIPHKTVVICAVGEEELAKEIKLGRREQGKFTAAVVRYLERNPQIIDIRELAERITAEELGIYEEVDPAPRAGGERFVLGTNISRKITKT